MRQNYADHAREMGSDPDHAPPFFSSKPADAVVESGAAIAFPTRTDDLYHEVELVIALGAGGADISLDDVLDTIFGWTVGIGPILRGQTVRAAIAGAEAIEAIEVSFLP